MKKFALIGAAGFVAPRHIKAINDYTLPDADWEEFISTSFSI